MNRVMRLTSTYRRTGMTVLGMAIPALLLGQVPDTTHAVTLTGSVANVNEYLQASDVFVFPSDYEGFSLSILEAMSVGLPLVSTRVGIAAELEPRGEFALLVPPKDKPAFRDALRRLVGPFEALPHRVGAEPFALHIRPSVRAGRPGCPAGPA